MTTLEDLAGKIDALAVRLDALLSGGAAALADAAEWQRMPQPRGDCPVSGWSRSTIQRHIDAGTVRTRKVGWCRYYSAADVRRIINQPQATP